MYALEKNKMVNGQPARAVSFFLDGNDPYLLPLVGDGLLPADVDGKQKPKTDSAVPIVGTQDDDAGYGATFDALNIWDLNVKWNGRSQRVADAEHAAADGAVRLDLPVRPDARDCLPQPGIDESGAVPRHPLLPAAADVPARVPQLQGSRVAGDEPVGRGGAGHRRRALVRDPAERGAYSLYQQGTYAPADGVDRWMGSIGQDKKGDMAPRVQRRQRSQRVPWHPLHGSARGRPARAR